MGCVRWSCFELWIKATITGILVICDGFVRWFVFGIIYDGFVRWFVFGFIYDGFVRWIECEIIYDGFLR